MREEKRNVARAPFSKRVSRFSELHEFENGYRSTHEIDISVKHVATCIIENEINYINHMNSNVTNKSRLYYV